VPYAKDSDDVNHVVQRLPALAHASSDACERGHCQGSQQRDRGETQRNERPLSKILNDIA
jgi:hypothetical protein